MVTTVLKTHFNKIKPSNICYRSYKHFELDSFRNELNISLQPYGINCMKYDQFKEIYMSILNKYAPIQSKIVRGNNGPFLNKTLSKSFMERSRLKNRYNKFPTEENYTNYKTQRNYCVNLVSKTKKEYYNNLNPNIFKDNKRFWKAIRPFIFDKQNIYQKDFIFKEVAEKMDNFFIEVIENLDIERSAEESTNEMILQDSIENIVKLYSKHPSKKVTIEETFSFNNITSNELENEKKALDPKKASVKNDIPAKMLIETNDISSVYLSDIYNVSKKDLIFPETLKYADVVPIYKKEERPKKENYRSVSLLPIVLKYLKERCIIKF